MNIATKATDKSEPPIDETKTGGGTLSDQLKLTARLAYLDMKDETLLSICLVSAIAAVLAPMLILVGLKFGVIDILRQELIQNPSYRLIRPLASISRSEEFYAALAARSNIAFVQPNVNVSGTAVRIRKADTKSRKSFALQPTAAGDPLVIEGGGKIPQAGEATLSIKGAEKLGVKIGDKIIIRVTRSNVKKREKEEVELTVKSVLRASADSRVSAYVPLNLVQDIERYRAGIPVASRSWTGIIGAPKQHYDSFILRLTDPMDQVSLNSLKIKSGFTSAEEMTAEDFKALTGHTVPPDQQIVKVFNKTKHVSGQSIRRMLDRMGGNTVFMLPQVDNMKGRFKDATAPIVVGDPSQFPITLKSGDVSEWQNWRSNISYGLVDRVIVPMKFAEATGTKLGQRIELSILPNSDLDATKDLTVSLYVDGLIEGDNILAHPALAGMLRRSRTLKMAYDPMINSVIQSDPGLRGFRAYAVSIDDVPQLHRQLADEGIPNRAKTEQIETVQRTDLALTQMVLLIGAVALIGGIAVLVASFYAAVERKKGDLALLRLVGLSRLSLFTMPVQQSIMFGAAGFLFAYMLFLIFASIINNFYAADLRLAGDLCRLSAGYVIIFLVVTIGIAALSSVVGAARATRIDPAEALRIE